MIAILLLFLGKNGVEQAIKTTRMPWLLRQLVTDSAVSMGMERQRAKIEASVIGALADPTNGFSGRICASLAHTLGAQLEEMAKNAEMSIEA